MKYIDSRLMFETTVTDKLMKHIDSSVTYLMFETYVCDQQMKYIESSVKRLMFDAPKKQLWLVN